MNILAISGSTRAGSTNTALLRAMAARAPAGVRVELLEDLADFPIFSPDLEGDRTPPIVEAFAARVRTADALLVASPEYVRAIPGGLKNAIDWLVSRDEIVDKPVALVHASHRGDDLLESLRRVLGTVSSRFDEASFARFPLVSLDRTGVAERLREPAHTDRMDAFWTRYVRFVANGATSPAAVPGWA